MLRLVEDFDRPSGIVVHFVVGLFVIDPRLTRLDQRDSVLWETNLARKSEDSN